jgi:hypothetical protein
MFGTLPFTVGEDYDLEHLAQEQKERRTTMIVFDYDLEHLAQEQKERRTTMIDFEFHRGLENSMTMFQAPIRQPATTNPIDGLARPTIETPLMTTRSSGLALSEIRTMKREEST